MWKCWNWNYSFEILTNSLITVTAFHWWWQLDTKLENFSYHSITEDVIGGKWTLLVLQKNTTTPCWEVKMNVFDIMWLPAKYTCTNRFFWPLAKQWKQAVNTTPTWWWTCSQTVAYLHVPQTVSNISIHVESCLWPPNDWKSVFHSLFSPPPTKGYLFSC